MDSNILNIAIGSGVLFPINLSQNEKGETGWYPITGSRDLILHNLNSIIQYELGFRIRQEDFGTRLWECIEEPNTQAQSFIVYQFVKRALVKWETRIDLTNVDLIHEGSKLTIQIGFNIKNTNQQDSVSATYEQ